MSNLEKQPAKQLSLKEMENALTNAPSIKSALTMDFVKDRFVKNFEAVTGRKDGSSKFEAELFAYMELLEDKPDLKKVDRFFHFSAMVKAGTTGLSFKDNKLYVIPKGGGIQVKPSPAGKREMLEMMKDIKRVPEPQLVMTGDKFVYDKLNNVIKEHISTDKTSTKINLDNIFASYTRIMWRDNTIIDVVVYHDDLVKAKAKSPAQSEASFWAQWPGEAAKKVSVNRAFRLYHKYPDNVAPIMREENDHDDDSITPYADADIVTTPSGDNVDTGSGEVIIPEEVNDDKKSKKNDPIDNEFT
jgi:hypothetical protein